MTADELREKFLNFFKSKGHAIIPSASLIPENDPTTLFTSSGMQPMVPYLLGEKHPEGTRIADSQKSFRASDIEDVGDNRHTTFFEMLGNWSLGDYFKKEQVSWIFEFLTKELGLDPERIYVSAYRGNEKLAIPKDNEATKIWQEEFKKKGIKAKIVDFAEKNGMQGGRIFFYDEKENWWSRSGVPENMPIGEPGGPDSEMFWDFGEHLKIHENSEWKDQPCHPACDCGRFLEIGNNVFMQFIKTKTGFVELDNKNIDFGGGLERLSVAVLDTPDVFMGDLFHLGRKKIEEICRKEYGQDEETTSAMRIILDHLRAATFLVADGALPANKDQGYFTRRLIRRSVRFAYKLDVLDNFCRSVAEAFIKTYERVYPELLERKNLITAEIEKEESGFRQTLEKGLKEFEKIAAVGKSIDGKTAFDLYQTYGFPLEMINEELERAGAKTINKKEFETELQKHQDLSRTASAGKFKGGLADASEETKKLHTAAHLLLAALRQVLGDHVIQKGSNITAERLRFDFSHPEKLTEDQKKQVEEIVNKAIESNFPVACEELSLKEAKQKGAMGVFESKYGGKVKVFRIGEKDAAPFSYEICGGPHVDNTGELGKFKITKEQSSSAGVRRIKGVLGK